ncbi:MAG: hypothetical protein KAQ89_01945 [Planctomycetes bacterium]|nr:hypothetical protein [Planctomycetota bacterium]
MAFGVCLYFDSNTEKKVFSVWQKLADEGLTSSLLDAGFKPHIALAVFEQGNVECLYGPTKTFAESIKSFEIFLCSIGSFPIKTRPIFYSPVPTKQLIETHALFHNHISSEDLGCEKYYLPGNWIPHCTIACNIENEDTYRDVFWNCYNTELPITGNVARVGIVEYPPAKEMQCFELK